MRRFASVAEKPLGWAVALRPNSDPGPATSPGFDPCAFNRTLKTVRGDRPAELEEAFEKSVRGSLGLIQSILERVAG
jgi:hypothetical protein